MKNKVLKSLATISECIGIGGLIVYFYNYFTLKGKYDVIPANIKSNENLYLLIGISGVLLFIIFKVLIYFTKSRNNDYNQLEMNLNEESKGNHENNNYYMNEPKYINEPIRYIVPEERKATCPNCGNTVDRNAFICLSCGFLLKEIPQQVVIHEAKEQNVHQEPSYVLPRQESNYNDEQYNPSNYVLPEQSYEEPNEKHNFNNITKLFTRYIPYVLIVILLAVGFIFAKDKLFSNSNSDSSNRSVEFYTMASGIIDEVQTKYDSNIIKINKSTTYFTLTDLDYASKDYDSDKSYIAIDASDKQNVKYYISLVGTHDYSKYSIDITEKSELNQSDVKINTGTIVATDNKLLVDNGNGITIYYKE